MRIYGLNGIGMGRVADIPGAVRQGEQDRMVKDVLEEQKRFENTTWLAGAAKYGLDNWGQPGILDQLVEEGKRRGILTPDYQAGSITKQSLVKLYNEAKTAIAGLEPKPEDTRTTFQKDYEYAQSRGFQGSPADWKRVNKAEGTNIHNYPSPQKGYRNVYGDDGRLIRQEPIPGTPEAREAEEYARAMEKKRSGEVAQADLVSTEIERGLATLAQDAADESRFNLPAGGWGDWLKWAPGTDANRLAQNLSTIQANIGFDKLQSMREASPTGGALGQVSERELGYLQDVWGSVQQAQDPAALAYNLKRLWNTYQDTIHGEGNGPERFDTSTPPEVAELRSGQSQNQPVQITNMREYDSLPPGTAYIDPNGQVRQKQ